MQPRRAASDNQFPCYGGGGIASIPSSYTFSVETQNSCRSEPARGTRGAVRRTYSYDEVQSAPGRLHGRSENAYPCPIGPPLAASSPDGGRPADAALMIDSPERPRTHGFALNETFTMGQPARPPSPGAYLDYMIEQMQGRSPSPQPGPSGMQGNVRQQRCPSPQPGPSGMQRNVDAPHLWEMDPIDRPCRPVPPVFRDDIRRPIMRPRRLFLPDDIDGPRQPPCPQPIQRRSPPPQPGQQRCPSPQPGPSGMQRNLVAPHLWEMNAIDRPCRQVPPEVRIDTPTEMIPIMPRRRFFPPDNIDRQQICPSPQPRQPICPPRQPQCEERSASPPRQPICPPRQPRQPICPPRQPSPPRQQPMGPPQPPCPQPRQGRSPSPQPGPSGMQRNVGQQRCPSPQPGPSGLQRNEGQQRCPSPQPGPSGLQRNVRFEAPSPSSDSSYSSGSDPGDQMVPQRDPDSPEILRPEFGPSGTEVVQPVIQGIQQMIHYGIATMNERQRVAQEYRELITQIQGAQEDSLQRLQEFRRTAIDNIQGYLHRANDIWDRLNDHISSFQRLAEEIEGTPVPSLYGIRDTVNVNQCAYFNLVHQGVDIARRIRSELGRDRIELMILVLEYGNVERQLRSVQGLLPNFLNYITGALASTAELQRTMNCSQCQLDLFMTEWREVCQRLPNEFPLDELAIEQYALPADYYQDPFVADTNVSTEDPTPPTTPRRATFSPRVSPFGIQRTPPCLPVRMQQWMQDAPPMQSPGGNLPDQENIFNDYNELEGQALGEVQHTNDESQSLNDSMDAMGGQNN